MIAARQGSPLAIGYGSGEMYLGSDAIALAPFTDTICYLEDGDWAVLTHEGLAIRDRNGAAVQRPVQKSVASESPLPGVAASTVFSLPRRMPADLLIETPQPARDLQHIEGQPVATPGP